MNKNPYEILGVAKNATDADIKKAYHKKVVQYHPDKNQGDKAAEEKFKDINNAFDILKDPQKRAAYDRFGEAAFAGGNGASAGAGGFNGNPFGGGGSFHFDMGGMSGAGMEEVLREAMRGFGFNVDDMAGFGGGFGGRRRPTRGRDLLDEVVISLRDAYGGKTHTVKFMDMVQNKQRTLDIKIPAGVADGTRLRVSGRGETAADAGLPAGDFYLDVRVRGDARFARDGADLYLRADVPFATLAMGGEIEVETIDDKKLSVKIPAGTQIGENLRVRGHGMPISDQLSVTSNRFGDLYINVVMTVPTRLSDKQKKVLSEFASLKDKKGWF
jgi:molecular chaperone DnaJ